MQKCLLIALLLGHLSLRVQAQQTATTRTRDLIYTRHDGVVLTLDVVQPKQPNGYGVISLVSGGWKSSHEGIGSGQPFTDRGYTVFYVVHGSQPRFTVEEITADIHRAVRFVRSRARSFGVDPDKLGITGSSAGGHLSLMVVTRGGPGNPQAKDSVDRLSSAVQAAALFYPPTDYLNWAGEGDVAVGVGKLAAYAAAFGPQASTAEGRQVLGQNVSPVYGVHAGQAPVFIIHGDADDQVPIGQAYRFQKRCREVGAVCEVKVVPGAGHGGWSTMAQDGQLLVDWFDRYLREGKKKKSGAN
jgi:dipeptidyl aminopeptidase/acylaminoacyl peptidase